MKDTLSIVEQGPLITQSFDLFSMYSNLFGILLWSFLYIFLKIHSIPTEVQYIHGIYFGIIVLFLTNIWSSDNVESTYEKEMKLKDDIENSASKLSIVIITVLFSTSLFARYKHVPKAVKQHFMTILSMALVLLLIVSSNISIKKNPRQIRKLRKLESVFLNTSLGLLCIAFVYMIHYM